MGAGPDQGAGGDSSPRLPRALRPPHLEGGSPQMGRHGVTLCVGRGRFCSRLPQGRRCAGCSKLDTLRGRQDALFTGKDEDTADPRGELPGLRMRRERPL